MTWENIGIYYPKQWILIEAIKAHSDFIISNGNDINIADDDAEDEIVINNNGQILSYPVDENALPEFFCGK
ncbi:hypothetical protein BGP_2101 [Beggiatoa sp. PS]|nr:hypothetical protein BGP_2101 [Beggiatoa sp. PS]